jgi:hypothetical protein
MRVNSGETRAAGSTGCQARVTQRTRSFVLAVLILAGGLALGACGPAAATPPTASSALGQDVPSARPTVVSASELEERLGIQMTLVAVTAGGGLLDIRFRVTDAAKAAKVFEPESAPVVIAGEGAVVIGPPEPPKGDTPTEGQVYILLYPNSGGAVKPGSKVVLAFGDVGLEYQTAP